MCPHTAQRRIFNVPAPLQRNIIELQVDRSAAVLQTALLQTSTQSFIGYIDGRRGYQTHVQLGTQYHRFHCTHSIFLLVSSGLATHSEKLQKYEAKHYSKNPFKQ